MADEADVGNEVAARDLLITETEIRRKASKREVEAVGYCLSCGEDIVDIGRRWCNSECRDMWSALSRAQINNVS